MSTRENARFVCPACTRSIAVTDAVRDALVESGCAVCGADVDLGAFDAAETA
ncbi:hypothetical protein QA600_11820 [Natronococcus sp. A-GB1]|uniref:DUF7560 family zinc ribbon protein n=1 Tax=Natronococcus sp. A-GB1 TaxID=3037648 RepID=UPI00241E4BE7|nr:hypothetical protein [Natronococcus sp. A-GB1]MDG5760028.1 hypothetical protein [Natronococcus sp. A-GB1]